MNRQSGFLTQTAAHRSTKTKKEKYPKMSKLKYLRRLATAGALVGAAVATTMVGVGTASATTPAASPAWITGTVQTDRGSGSDTTFYIMQKISDLYNQAGLYGCALSSDDYTCLDDTAPYNDSNDPDNNKGTTDYTDNYDRTEEVQGVDEVGSGAGQAQLCDVNYGSNNAPLPSWAKIDYARSSSGITSAANVGSTCEAALKEDYFAADAVDLLDFFVNPSAYGTATSTYSGYNYAAVNGGVIGDVAQGWVPPQSIPSGEATDGTESINCDTTALIGPNGQFGNGINNCAGYPFYDIDNTNESFASGGDDAGTGAASVAYAIWCQSPTIPSITDWGQLTNIGPFTNGVPSKPVGSGTSFGLHINLIGVNPSSGTNGVWTKWVQSGQSACNSDGNESIVNGDTHLALENNAAQIDDFATTDFPSDLADQAVELATSLYYVANGVYNASPYQSSAALTAGGVKNAATLKSFPGQLVGLNTQYPSSSNVFAQTFPTARELGNIYLSTAIPAVSGSGIRASTAGFLNWICDDNNAFQKGKDLSDGINYDAEITTLVNTTYGFIRLDDTNAPTSCPLITSVVNSGS